MRIGGIPIPLVEWLETSFSVYIDAALKLCGAEGISVDPLPHATQPRRHDLPIVTLGFEIRWH